MPLLNGIFPIYNARWMIRFLNVVKYTLSSLLDQSQRSLLRILNRLVWCQNKFNFINRSILHL